MHLTIAQNMNDFQNQLRELLKVGSLTALPIMKLRRVTFLRTFQLTYFITDGQIF